MGRNLMAQITKYISSQKRRKAGYWVLFGLSAVVVFCTTYALILPAITISNELRCGMEAHTHSESCWSLQAAEPVVELICEDWKEADIVFHHHDGFCYDGADQLICPLEEREAHVHGEQCYIEQRELICQKEETGDSSAPGGDAEPVPEVIPEVVEPHVHTDACYTMVQGALICGQDEVEGHIHDDSCYIVENTAQYYYICGEEQTADGHQHDDTCLAVRLNPILTCTREEIEGHVHTDDCYEWESVLTCDEEETDPSWPEAPIAAPEPGQPEEPHVHTDECYEITYLLVCQEEEAVLHTHGPECYETVHVDDGQGGLEEREVLTCTLPVVIEHQHTEECVQTVESEDKEVMVRTCGMTVHVHTDECYVDMGPEPDPYFCGLAEHQHNEECWFEDGELRCTMPEHTHTEECLDPENFPDPEYPVEDPVEDGDAGDIEEPIDFDDLPDDVGAFAQLLPLEPEDDSPLFREEPEQEEKNSILPVEEGFEQKPELESDSIESLTQAGLQRTYASADDSGLITHSLSVTAAAAPAAGEKDFTDCITSVSVKHNGEEVTEGTVVTTNDSLEFRIYYTLDSGWLAGSDTISYQLPEQLSVVAGASGDVVDSSYQVVGRYSVDETGKVKVVFNENYVKANEASPIAGSIRFKASVTNVTSTTPEKVELKFRDDLTIHFQVKEEEKPEHFRGDLSVQKTAGNPNPAEDGTVVYTIKVKSTEGTFDVVELKDMMTGLGMLSKLDEISITAKSGETGEETSVDCHPESTENGFNITLPQMGAGDEYTITYKAKLEGDLKEGAEGTNEVTVESKKDNGDPLEGEDKVKTEKKQSYVGKKLAWDNDLGKHVWQITVNEGGNDIKDWKLEDNLNGESFAGPVTIKDADGKIVAENVELPYIFGSKGEDTKGTYYITYPVDKPLGSSQIINNATLTGPKPDPGPGPDGPSHSDTAETWTRYEPLKKEANSDPTVNSDGTITTHWTVTIDPTDGTLPAGWVFRDELWNGQNFKDDPAALEQSIRAQIDACVPGLEYTFEIGTKKNGEGGNPEGRLEITFKSPLPMGSKPIVFSYDAIAVLTDPDTEKTYTNHSEITSGNKKVEANPTTKYKPSKIQVSKTNNGTDEKDYYTTKTYYGGKQENGLLTWNIKIVRPEDYKDGAITVEEKLPDGVDLTFLEILAQGAFGAETITPLGTYTFKDDSTDEVYQIDASTSDGKTITIEIPENLMNNDNLSEIRFVVQAKVRDDFKEWTTDADGVQTAKFLNEVEVKSKDSGKVVGKDYAEQTMKKNTGKYALKKGHESGGGNDNKEFTNNMIKYLLDINTSGEDLLEGSDTITLVDELSYWDDNNKMNVSLLPGSVKVYHWVPDAEGNRGDELDPSEFTFGYHEEPGGGGKQAVRTLTIELPDSTPLVVEYTYIIPSNSETLDKELYLTNKAHLEGYITGGGEKTDSFTIKVIESDATADILGVNIYKTDADSGVALVGAVFELWEYDETTKGYTKQVIGPDGSTKFTVNENGVVTLTRKQDKDIEGDQGGLRFNTAYQLREITAPDGYELPEAYYEFYVSGDTAAYPECMPDGFKDYANVHYAGQIITYPNVSKTTSVKVQKVWQDTDGRPDTNPDVSSINVRVMRQAYVKSTDVDVPQGDMKTVSVKILFENANNSYDPNNYREITGSWKFAAGTTVQMIFTNSLDNPNYHPFDCSGVTLNGENVDWKLVGLDYIWEFIVEDNVRFEGLLKSNDYGDWSCRAIAAIDENSLVPYGDPKQVGRLNLSRENAWSGSISNLDREGTEKGKHVYYRYYVVEDPMEGYAVSYSTSDGIVYGTITITNKKIFTLPKTGGPGSMMYTTGGLLLCAAGGLLYSKSKRKGADDRG